MLDHSIRLDLHKRAPFISHVLSAGAGLLGLTTAERSMWWLLIARVAEKAAAALLLVPRHELGEHMPSYGAVIGAHGPRRHYAPCIKAGSRSMCGLYLGQSLQTKPFVYWKLCEVRGPRQAAQRASACDDSHAACANVACLMASQPVLRSCAPEHVPHLRLVSGAMGEACCRSSGLVHVDVVCGATADEAWWCLCPRGLDHPRV